MVAESSSQELGEKVEGTYSAEMLRGSHGETNNVDPHRMISWRGPAALHAGWSRAPDESGGLSIAGPRHQHPTVGRIYAGMNVGNLCVCKFYPDHVVCVSNVQILCDVLGCSPVTLGRLPAESGIAWPGRIQPMQKIFIDRNIKLVIQYT